VAVAARAAAVVAVVAVAAAAALVVAEAVLAEAARAVAAEGAALVGAALVGVATAVCRGFQVCQAFPGFRHFLIFRDFRNRPQSSIALSCIRCTRWHVKYGWPEG
jgi:hypothetical protein